MAHVKSFRPDSPHPAPTPAEFSGGSDSGEGATEASFDLLDPLDLLGCSIRWSIPLLDDPPKPAKPADRKPDSQAGATLGALRDFHDQVDARATRLASRLGDRLQCRRGCASCCVDDLSVFQIEAERIRRNHSDLLRDGAPHPTGACAFLDGEGACRIYLDRPYVCRTQGLPFRWFDQSDESDQSGGSSGAPVAERRDICPLNETDTPLEDLPDEDCWLLGPAEAELAQLAELAERESVTDSSGGSPSRPERVALRSLFRRVR